MTKEYLSFSTLQSEPNDAFMYDTMALLWLMDNMIASQYPALVKLAAANGITITPADQTAFEGNSILQVLNSEYFRRGLGKTSLIMNAPDTAAARLKYDIESKPQKLARFQALKNKASAYVPDEAGSIPGIPSVDSSGKTDSGSSVINTIEGKLSDLEKSIVKLSVINKVFLVAASALVIYTGYRLIKKKPILPESVKKIFHKKIAHVGQA